MRRTAYTVAKSGCSRRLSYNQWRIRLHWITLTSWAGSGAAVARPTGTFVCRLRVRFHGSALVYAVWGSL